MDEYDVLYEMADNMYNTQYSWDRLRSFED